MRAHTRSAQGDREAHRTTQGARGSRADLAVLAVLPVLSPVKHPLGDLELQRVLDDRNEPLDLIVRKLAGAAVAFEIRN